MSSSVLLALLFLFCDGATVKRRYFDVPLDPEDRMHLYWDLYYEKKTIAMELHVKISPEDWFAFGFSPYGELSNADLCVCWVDDNLKVRVQDYWTDADGKMYKDRKQDFLVSDLERDPETTVLVVQRKFDTCDSRDFILTDGTVHVLYAFGRGLVEEMEGKSITDAINYGFQRVQLLKTMKPNYLLPDNAKEFEILNDKVHVPAQETTYWCSLHKLPDFSTKHHVTQYEAVIEEGHESLVHHMEVFHCEVDSSEELPDYNGPCQDEEKPSELEACKRVIAAWAMGAGPLVYPLEAGSPIGGPDFSPYVMLEVHYNNPEERDDWVDSSGVRLHYVSKLRKYDVGIMEIGVEYTPKMAIPPHQTSFALTGHCVLECTETALPPFGINVFASQLHTHLTGKQVFTRHIRGGVELLELNRDNNYSPHFQEIRLLKRPVQVIPGDALITTCIYHTENRTNVTLGGLAITDEMCVNYIHYYPKTDLEVCKSSISTAILKDYFKFMEKFERQQTSDDKGVEENYRSIQWTPFRSQLLSELYENAPLSMQCNRSNGERFPGHWENLAQGKIFNPLMPTPRDCPSRE